MNVNKLLFMLPVYYQGGWLYYVYLVCFCLSVLQRDQWHQSSRRAATLISKGRAKLNRTLCYFVLVPFFPKKRNIVQEIWVIFGQLWMKYEAVFTEELRFCWWKSQLTCLSECTNKACLCQTLGSLKFHHLFVSYTVDIL